MSGPARAAARGPLRDRLRGSLQTRVYLLVMWAALGPVAILSWAFATRIHRLDDEPRVEELARMLGGERVTDEARANARRLLDVPRRA